MKGQMYLILAVITATLLVVLKISVNINSIVENDKNLQLSLEDLEFKNIERGIRQSLEYSYLMQNISDNVNYFTDFVRSSETNRGNTFAFLSVQSSYPNATGSVTMNTSVRNSLGANIDNLTMVWSWDGSSQSFGNVADNSTLSTNFTVSAASPNYTLSVYYTIANFTTNKNVTIPVEAGKGRFVGFYTLAYSTPRTGRADDFTSVAILNQTQYT